MAGVLMAVPPVDFQLHNSLFLVAHFHMMIVGGVLFGLFAGLIYWLPKILGFRLNERLGRYSFWCWLVGFLTAFVPLYVLGLMGATRRLDHYDASTGWRPLFIVAGLGVSIIGAGVAFMVLQVAYSIYRRRELRDSTGDPWNGRTLEWSIPSPMPFYNFAVLPKVSSRDPFWAQKYPKDEPDLEIIDNSKPAYEDILLPRNSGMGIVIAGFAFTFAFSMVWHILWLGIIGVLGVIITIIIRSTDEKTDYVIKAKEVQKLDEGYRKLQEAGV
jgi:cytochrome o ubiquinol oxidase subunit 1